MQRGCPAGRGVGAQPGAGDARRAVQRVGPLWIEAIDTTASTTRLRVPAATSPQALLDQLATQGRVERFGFGPPRLSRRFSEVVGASVAEMETRAERAELEETAS